MALRGWLWVTALIEMHKTEFPVRPKVIVVPHLAVYFTLHHKQSACDLEARAVVADDMAILLSILKRERRKPNLARERVDHGDRNATCTATPESQCVVTGEVWVPGGLAPKLGPKCASVTSRKHRRNGRPVEHLRDGIILKARGSPASTLTASMTATTVGINF